MPTVFFALYENGVLRPTRPLPLVDGETVQITLAHTVAPAPVQGVQEEEGVERIRTAKTLDEWIAAADAARDIENEYDLPAALDYNRRLSGDQRT